MESLAVRLFAVSVALVSLAGCGTRTPLDLHDDGAIEPLPDGGPRMDAGGACTTDVDCDDGRMCNGREVCGRARTCVSGPPLACADGIDCTVDECVERVGCVSRPDDSLCPGGAFCDVGIGGCSARPCDRDGECDDGFACNGIERCGPDGVCAAGEPTRCDDGVDCTIDSCDEPGVCQSRPDDARCAGAGTCDPMIGCLGVMCGSDEACDDGRICNGTEVCAGGLCSAGPRPLCDDGIACTVDVCSDAFGGCTSSPDSSLCPAGQICDSGAGCVVRPCMSDASCDDGMFCNGIEICGPAGTCLSGSPPSCDDGASCTIDRCLEPLGCVSEPRSTRDVCGNRVDDDCDGLIDCEDDDCRGTPACPSCVPVAGSEVDCFDGRDDDCDGAVDCADRDCDPICAPVGETNCVNGLDDDGDGLVDCADSDCRFDPSCRDAGADSGIRDAGPPRDSGPPPAGELGVAACTNGIDDDGDGRIDCRDPDCSPFGPMGECCNGIDDDGDGNADIFTCRCYEDSTCVGVGDLDQVCWESTFSVCAPRCNFYGGDTFCSMFFPDLPRCNATTGECMP